MRLFNKFEPTAAILEIKGFVELVELIFLGNFYEDLADDFLLF